MLSIETDNRQSVSVVKVKGRVDSETAPELDDALTKLLQDNRNQIALNLQGVDYCHPRVCELSSRPIRLPKKQVGIFVWLPYLNRSKSSCARLA